MSSSNVAHLPAEIPLMRNEIELLRKEQELEDRIRYAEYALWGPDEEPDHCCTPDEMVDFMRQAEQAYGEEVLQVEDESDLEYLQGKLHAVKWMLGRRCCCCGDPIE